MTLIKKNNNLIFPSLLDEFFKPDWNGGTQNAISRIPAVNIKETEMNFKLELFAPGLIKNDFQIEIDQKILSISSEKEISIEDGNEKYSRKEFNPYPFKRTFSLPDSINIDNIDASYENGVLYVNLPKKEEALPKPKRLVEVG